MEATKKQNTRLIILAFTVMALFGFLMNLRGALIPSFRNSFNVSYSSIGLMIFVADIGYMIASFFGGVAGDKYGLKSVLTCGFVIVILSVLSMTYIDSFILLVIVMFLISIGMGSMEICLNALGARIFIANAAIMMNFLHFFYGVGSSVSPKYVGWLLMSNIPWKEVYLYSLILISIIFIYLLFTSFPQKDEKHNTQKIPLGTFVSDKRVWLFSGLLGFCIVVEAGIGTWLVNFLQVFYSMNVNDSSFYMSLFFIFFTAGRLAGGFIVEKLGYIKALFYFTLSTLMLLLFGLILGGGWIILFSLTGFFISVMYPTIMTIIMKEFTKDTTAAMGLIITAGGAVNMVFNWLIGKTSDYFGVWTGFASILIYASMIIVLLLALKGSLVNKYHKLKE